MNYQQTFEKDGLIVLENWIANDKLQLLNRELDYYFSDYSINASMHSQFYDKSTKIFDHTHFLASINFAEMMVDLAHEWKKIYPNFENDGYILTRASLKEEANAPDPILWHRDKPQGTLRNIFYLNEIGKESGLFRYMVGTHKTSEQINFAMTEKEFNEHSHFIHDCVASPGSVLFFDANGFHCNYPRINARRSIILTWTKPQLGQQDSRILFSSNNLTPKVLENMKYFSNPNLTLFKDKDYDFNPPRFLPPSVVFSYLLKSINQHCIIELKIFIKSILDKLRGKQQKYRGSFVNEQYK